MSDLINVPLKARTALEDGKSPQMAGDILNLTLQQHAIHQSDLCEAGVGCAVS
jgi:hypothetical protein